MRRIVIVYFQSLFLVSLQSSYDILTIFNSCTFCILFIFQQLNNNKYKVLRHKLECDITYILS